MTIQERPKIGLLSSMSINIVGEVSGHSGMKATLEGYVRALEAIGADVTIVDPLSPPSSANPADINLVCCEVASHFVVRSRLGEEFFRNRYNIGIWLWESTHFPKEWYDRFIFYDEIWAPTSFIATALSPISPVPVVRMPFVLEPKAFGSRTRGRRRLGIYNDAFVYLFVFNFHSRFERKNPLGVIQAFKECFGPTERAHLVIKCVNADFNREHFQKLTSEAGTRITICDGAWPEEEMRDLMAACDCYVSLHRAEGVGLTISDAMAAGKPVVATGWSGNMDFMTVANSFPVRYQLVELKADVAQYRAGGMWAEPSVTQAADMMRYVFHHRDEATERGEVARRDIQREYSASAVGSLLTHRLAVISKRRQFDSLRQSVANPVSDLDRFREKFAELGAYVPEKQFRYEQLKRELREIVQLRVPTDATLLVVSKGDEELLCLNGHRARHFPLDRNRQYAGYYPKDNAEAIQQLETARDDGAGFLVFPRTAFWWFDHYKEFREHLLTRYVVAYRDESCVIFELALKAYEENISSGLRHH